METGRAEGPGFCGCREFRVQHFWFDREGLVPWLLPRAFVGWTGSCRLDQRLQRLLIPVEHVADAGDMPVVRHLVGQLELIFDVLDDGAKVKAPVIDHPRPRIG